MKAKGRHENEHGRHCEAAKPPKQSRRRLNIWIASPLAAIGARNDERAAKALAKHDEFFSVIPGAPGAA